MFWAGKRGRRSSAGSLESNVEVSRSPSGWLSCVTSRPRFLPIVFFFSCLFFFAPPSLLHRDQIHPACLARACRPPRRARAPHRLWGLEQWGRVRVCLSRFSLRLTPAPRPLSMVNAPAPRPPRGPAPSLSVPPSRASTLRHPHRFSFLEVRLLCVCSQGASELLSQLGGGEPGERGVQCGFHEVPFILQPSRHSCSHLRSACRPLCPLFPCLVGVR